jgi:flagellar biogenesis protein FliO
MLHLISCLLLLPFGADAGWASGIASAPVAEGGCPMRVDSSASSDLDPRPSATPAQAARQLPPLRRAITESSSSPGPASAGRTLSTVIGSLAIVLGAFLLVAWVTRKATPRHLRPLPTEVIECLGRAPLAGRQQMQLVRIGKKLVLLSVTATDARTLCEVTDPLEVDRLAGLCEQTRADSVTANFRQVLAAAAAEPISRASRTAAVGFVDRGARVEGRAVVRERKS